MWIYYFMIGTIGFFCRFFWIGKVEGRHNVPRKGRVIIASNHQSWLDFCFLATVLHRRLYFLIANKFYQNPVFSFALKRMKHIRVELDETGRERLYTDANRLLSEEKALVVFPEGWMTFDGKIQRAYLGVARIALSSKSDIVPAVIESYHIYPRHAKHPKFTGARCRIKFLEPLRYKEFKNLDPSEIVHDLLMPRIAAELGHDYPKEK